MARHGVFELVKKKKIEKKLSWEDIANEIGMSKEWTVAALLDRMTLQDEQARKLCTLLDIDEEQYLKYLSAPPNRNCAVHGDVCGSTMLKVMNCEMVWY